MENEIQEIKVKDAASTEKVDEPSSETQKNSKKAQKSENFDLNPKINKNTNLLIKNKRERQNTAQEEAVIRNLSANLRTDVKSKYLKYKHLNHIYKN